MKKAVGRPLKSTELSALCTQLSLLLSAGISCTEALSLLAEDEKTASGRAILEALRRETEEQGSLRTALENTKICPAYMTELVGIGEYTGHLDEVTDALGRHYRREAAIERSIRTAVTYPLLMAVLMVLVIMVLLIRVMPIFRQVFLSLGTELTGLARSLLGLGEGLRRYSPLICGVLILFTALELLLTCTRQGREILRRWGYKIRSLRGIMEQTSACRFAGGLSLTLRSGLEAEEGLELAGRLVEDPVFTERTEKCRALCGEGRELSAALRQSGIFTGLYAGLCSVGERTGELDGVMEQIASLCEEEAEERLHGLLAMLEPAFVAVLAVVVGAILLAVMLPLMSLLSGL